MAKTIVGLFDRTEDAQNVVQELVKGGFDRNDISLVANNAQGKAQTRSATDTSYDNGDGKDTAEAAGSGAVSGTFLGGAAGLLVGLGALVIPGIGPVIAAGPLATVLGTTALGAGLGAAAGGLIGALTKAGVPEEDAHLYSEGVRRGGTLVMVRAEDNQADDAYDILQRYGAVDIDERGADFRKEGWNGFDQNSQPYTTDQVDTYRTQYNTGAQNYGTTATDTTNYRNNNQDQTVLPVVEEQLNVGKRQVQRGGVRVYTNVEERPVQQDVTLREEHVNVDRRAVDRPVTDADMNSFQNGTYEVTETAEVPVVSKEARVVEEVGINKEVQERTERVQDTVRRRDVEVEEIDGNTTDNTGYTTGTNTTDYNNNNRGILYALLKV